MYNDQRSVWHANLGPYLTPEMLDVTDQLDLIVQSNRQDGDRVRSAAVLDAYPGLGKTTLVVHYGARFHQDQMDMYGPTTATGSDRIPVAYVRLTSNTTMRSLNSMLCHFYAHPAADRGNATVLGARASQRALDSATRLIIVDDVHFLDMKRQDGREVANHFKWLANEFAATFLFVGVGIAERGLLTEGLSTRVQYAQTARRWTRTSLSPFGIEDAAGRKTWRSLLLAIERDIVLEQGSGDDRRRPGGLSLRALYRTLRVPDDAARTRLPTSGQVRAGIADSSTARHSPERRRLRAGAASARRKPAQRAPEHSARRGMTLPRRIPMRLPPLPGESFDSWLIAYAHRLDAPIADLLAHSGVDLRAVSTEPRRLARGPSAAALERVSYVTGHSREELELTFSGLRRYEAELRLAHVSGRSFLSAPMRSSRFCPVCLADNEGRWQVSWRLPWVVACPRHRVLLATCCPSCEAPQRRRRVRTDNSPNDPRFCAEPAARATGRNPVRCAADLTPVETDAADPRLVDLAAAWNASTSRTWSDWWGMSLSSCPSSAPATR